MKHKTSLLTGYRNTHSLTLHTENCNISCRYTFNPCPIKKKLALDNIPEELTLDKGVLRPQINTKMAAVLNDKHMERNIMTTYYYDKQTEQTGQISYWYTSSPSPVGKKAASDSIPEGQKSDKGVLKSQRNTKMAEMNTNRMDNDTEHERKQWTERPKPKMTQHEPSEYVNNLKTKRKLRREKLTEELKTGKVEQQAAVAQFLESTRKDYKTGADKDESRKYYALRHQTEEPVQDKRPDYTTQEIEIPMFNRMKYYIKNHKCSHEKNFNVVKLVDSGHYVFGCNHNTSKISNLPAQGKCANCGNPMFNRYTTACNCSYLYCRRCKTSNYEYEHVQFFDQHDVIPGKLYTCVPTTETIHGITNTTYIDHIVDAPPQLFKAFKPRISRKQFRESMVTMKGRNPENPWGRVTNPDIAPIQPFSLECDVNNEEREEIDSMEQGGTISSAANAARQSLNSVNSTVSAKFKHMKDEVLKLKDRITNLDAALSGLTEFYEILAFFFEVCASYCVSSLGVEVARLLYDLYKHGLSGTAGFGLAAIAMTLHEEEKKSRNHVRAAKYSYEFIKNCDFGVLTPLVRRKTEQFIDSLTILDPERVYVSPKVVNTGLFAFFEVIDKEQGPEEIIGTLCTFLREFFTKSYQGLKLFSVFAKDILPGIMLCNQLSNLSSLVFKGINKVVEHYLDGAPPKIWLQQQLAKKGSPIMEMQTTFLAYQAACAAPGLYKQLEPTAIRTQFYIDLKKATQFVIEHNKLGVEWYGLVSYFEKGLNETPPPVDRPFEPFVLALSGIPGTGKSTMWPIMIAEVLKLKSPEKVRETTHTFTNINEFQPGMSSKRVILFDDMGQDKTTNTEALNLVALCTSAPYMINSPNIVGPEIKGLFAIPEAVVACSNDPEWNTQLLYSKDAVLRRMDLHLKVIKKINIADPKFGEQEVFNVVSCHRYPSLNGKAISLNAATILSGMIAKKKKEEFADLKKKLKDLEVNVDEKYFENLTSQPDTTLNTKYFSNRGILSTEFSEYCKARNADKDVEEKPDPAEYIDAEDRDVPSTEQFGIPATVVDGLGFLKNLFELCLLDQAIMGHSIIMWAIAGRYWKDLYDGFKLNLGMRSYLFSTAKFLINGTLALMGGVLLYKAYVTWKSDAVEESGTTKTAKAKGRALIASREQAGMQEAIKVLLKRATGAIQNSESGVQVNCIFVGDRYILTVNHFFQDYVNENKMLEEGTVINIRKYQWNTVKQFQFRKENLVYFRQPFVEEGREIREDVVLYKLDKKFSLEQNIVKHFWDGSYNITNMEVAKFDYIAKMEKSSAEEFEISSGKVTKDAVYTRRQKGEDVYYHQVAMANYKNRNCSCGSAVARTDTPVENILGIHVAANVKTEESLFHFVTRSDLEIAMSGSLDVEQSGFVESSDTPLYPLQLPPVNNLEFIGNLDKKHRSYQNAKTDLQRSLAYECHGEHISEPSLLNNKDPRLPEQFREDFYKDLAKGFGYGADFEESELSEATQALVEEHRAANQKSSIKQRLLTDEEMLNGVPGWNGTSRMDMTTSAGWPYNCEGLKRKDMITETETGKLIMGPRLKRDFENAWRSLEAGIVPMLPYVLTIKDERVKLKKIYIQPKSRYFSNSNLVSFLIFRKIFHSHMMVVYNEKYHYAAASIDRISIDWHHMISHMIEVGTQGFDGDYAFWDKSIPRILISAAFDIGIDSVKSLLSPRFIEALRELVVAPYYVMGSALLKADGTMPSGMLMTFLFNCHMNEILHRSAYLAIMRKRLPVLGTMKAYRQNNRGKRGGDDTIQVVSQLIAPHFNGETYGNWINAHGMEYTSTDKTDNIIALKDFKKLSFLKNTTGMMGMYYVPLGDMKELEEQCYWIRLSKFNSDARKATSDNCNAALRAVYFYGKKTYNDFRDRILNKEPSLELLTFGDLKTLWEGYYYFPGSAAGYSTRKDQDNEFDIDAKPKTVVVRGLEVKPSREKMEILNDDEIQYQSGRDTAAMNQDVHVSAGVESVITPDQDAEATPLIESSNEIAKTTVLGTTMESSERADVGIPRVAGKTVGSTNIRAEKHMNDTNWTLQKLAQKFTMVKKFDWAISDPAGTVLLALNIPNDVLVTPALRTPFETTGYWRPKYVTIRVTFAGSPFYAGRLVVGFLPSMETTTPPSSSLIGGVAEYFIQMGGSQIDVANNKTLDFKIPYRHYLSWAEYPTDCLGQFGIVVLNPLRTGAGNESKISMTTFVAIEGSEFKVPEYVTTTTKFSTIASREQSGIPDTEIELKKTDMTINNKCAEYVPTMLCAGEGLVSTPSITQFADHPVNQIDLLKRYRLAGHLHAELSPADATTQGYGTIDVPVKNLIDSFDELRERYWLWRGGLQVKIVMKTLKRASSEEKGMWAGRVYLLQGNTTRNIVIAEQDKEIHSAHHYFDEEHIAEFTIPYCSPTFTSKFGNFGDANGMGITQMVMKIAFSNYHNTDLILNGDFYIALADDFSVGVFGGFEANPYFSLRKPRSKILNYSYKKEDKTRKRNVPKRFERTSDSEYDIYEESGIVPSVEQSGILEFIDRAIENTVPIVEKVDAILNTLDAHPVCLQPQPIKPRPMGYLVPTNQVQYSERLKMTNTNGMNLADKECYGNDENETDIYRMMQGIKTLIKKDLPWKTSDVQGTVLWSTKVGPFGDDMAADAAMTPIDAYAMNFDFWTGSQIYIFDVVATKQHHGRLTLTYHPNLTSAPSDLGLATQQYWCSFDLSEGRGFAVIQIPYLSKYNYRPIGVNPQRASATYPYPPEAQFNGVIALRVQDELRGSTTVADQVHVNIYKYAGKDFRLDSYGGVYKLQYA